MTFSSYNPLPLLAGLQGHHHSGSYSNIAGIHYYTLKALVEGSGPENNSYAIAEVHPDGSIAIAGYRKAVSKQLTLTQQRWVPNKTARGGQSLKTEATPRITYQGANGLGHPCRDFYCPHVCAGG